jgi:hypothetical protein
VPFVWSLALKFGGSVPITPWKVLLNLRKRRERVMSVPPINSSAVAVSSLIEVIAASEPQLKSLAAVGDPQAVVELAKRQHVHVQRAQGEAPEVSEIKPSFQPDTIGNNLNTYV